ncbi:hypothetical protein FAIPA1_10075 [Frankia sp. AiPs1]
MSRASSRSCAGSAPWRADAVRRSGQQSSRQVGRVMVGRFRSPGDRRGAAARAAPVRPPVAERPPTVVLPEFAAATVWSEPAPCAALAILIRVEGEGEGVAGRLFPVDAEPASAVGSIGRVLDVPALPTPVLPGPEGV